MTQPISTFVAEMQALLTQRDQAQSDAEKRQAEDAMADLIRRHYRGERVRAPAFDPRAAQLPAGERE